MICRISWRARLRASALTLSLLLGAVVCGCSQVDPRPDYQRVRDLIRESTTYDVAYDPTQPGLSTAELHTITSDGVTRDEAVRIGILNSRKLQAEFLEIGVARADWVQSGLLSNPTLGLGLLLPEGGGLGNFALDLSKNIVDLWQIPIRRNVAERRVEETVLRIARSAAELSANVRRAYYRAVAAEALSVTAADNLELLRKSLDTVRAQFDAGAVRSIDMNLARAEVLRAELALRDAQLEAKNANRELVKLLSLSASVDVLRLNDPLPAGDALPTSDELIALALEERLDLRSLERAADAAEQEIRLEYAKVFPEISVGLGLEQNERRSLPGRHVAADFARASIAAGAPTVPTIESRAQRQEARDQQIDWKFGPTLSMTLPVFDQNQAQIAKALYRHDQALRLHEDLYLSIAHDIRILYDRAATAQRNVAFYRDELLPQAQQNIDFATASFQAGEMPILLLLEAQRTLLDTRRGYLDVWSAAAIAMADLEQTVGAPLARSGSAASQPAMQPGGQP